MKLRSAILTGSAVIMLLSPACKSMNKTQKGVVIGAAGGAVVGGVIGKATGNTALGTILGAAIGGTVGGIIGKKMDKQAEDIKKEVPGAKVERVGEGIVVEFNNKILFGFDRSDLSDAAKINLDNLVTVLNKYPDTNIEIQGHTDDTGTEAYNQTLSEKRAAVVSTHLKNKKVAASRINTKGFGETSPKYANDNEENRSLNRRVDFLITANEKMIADAKKEAGQ